MTQKASQFRADAQALSDPLPPLLVAANQLVATNVMGMHGRRRAGMGDEFWQYRPAVAGDSARDIDWRRSGRSDAHYVREKEWQSPQTIYLWIDDAPSMNFASAKTIPTKGDRARLLGLASAILLLRAGEKVGLAGDILAPKSGHLHINRLARALARDTFPDVARAHTQNMSRHARCLYISDFLGAPDEIESALKAAADRGIKGAMVQTLDPEEVVFPYKGRTVFESIAGDLRYETRKADDLRKRYQERLRQRQDWLAHMARVTGWQFDIHITDRPASAALLWIYGAMSARGTQARG